MSCKILCEISSKAVNSVLPTTLIRSLVSLSRDGDDVTSVNVDGQTFVFDDKRGCHVVGFGKAVLGMAAELNRFESICYVLKH
jgi:hypothetical protein